MKFTELRLGVARTINLGNYESVRIEVGVTVCLADGDDLIAAKATAQTEMRTLAEETYRAQHRPKEPTPRPGLQAPAGFKPPDPEY